MANEPETKTETGLAKREKTDILEYKPFHSDQTIKLSIGIVRSMLAVPTSSGKLPEDRDCMRFMMLCRARQLNPFEGDAYLIGFDGRDGAKFELITAHGALIKRAEVHPEYNGLESGIVFQPPAMCNLCNAKGYLEKSGDLVKCPRCGGRGESDEVVGSVVPKDTKLAGGWARITFKNKPVPMYDRVNLSAYQKSFGRWTVDSPGQIQKCAEASVLRLAFPNTLGGLYLREEMESAPSNIPVPVHRPPPMFDAPEVSPPKPPSDAPQSPQDEPQSGAPPVVLPSAGKTTEEVVRALQEAMRQHDVSEDQLTAYCRISKLATPKQEVFQLADAKLRMLLDEFEQRLPDIRDTLI